ncbi:MAG TPA: NTP transferase domain-containing protein [Acidimicrobiales bacterium]|nr:NTP transferase domain-containing protein [Acidimicrobiales bacterium]
MTVAGVVLAGGAGRRLGGVDKALLRVGGVTLLDRVLSAARPVCDSLVVVGPSRPVDVRFVREPEPGGGPVPAVRAGLAALPGSDIVLVLAADLPFLGSDHLRLLLAHVEAAAADRGGPNPLLAAYRRAALAARLEHLGAGDPAGKLLPAGVATVDLGPATLNVNRPEDVEAAELLVEHEDHVVATAHWLRELVTATVPDAVERVYPGWHGFGYRHPRAGYFCAVFPRAETVQLSFEHGARLPDPRGLLSGEGRQVRYVDVRTPGDPPADLLVELIDAALVDPTS